MEDLQDLLREESQVEAIYKWCNKSMINKCRKSKKDLLTLTKNYNT